MTKDGFYECIDFKTHCDDEACSNKIIHTNGCRVTRLVRETNKLRREYLAGLPEVFSSGVSPSRGWSTVRMKFDSSKARLDGLEKL